MVAELGTDEGTTVVSRRSSGGRNLPVAIVVGVVLAALFLVSLFYRPWSFPLVVWIVATVAVIETGRSLRQVGRPVAVPVLLVTVATMLFGTYRAGTAGQIVGVLVLFAGAVVWELAAHDRHDVVNTLGLTVFVGLWIAFLASFGVLLVLRPMGGAEATVAVIGGAIFGDIGGFAVGSLIGKHPIAPTVSPNKTWEGLAGSVVLTALVAWFALPLIGSLFTGRPLVGVAVAVLAALAGFFGDLTESMVKRDLGLKDLGSLLPGHGGILDRVDGVLLALPVGYYAVALLT